jgi:hypothetical protein
MVLLKPTHRHQIVHFSPGPPGDQQHEPAPLTQQLRLLTQPAALPSKLENVRLIENGDAERLIEVGPPSGATIPDRMASRADLRAGRPGLPRGRTPGRR